MKKAIIYSFISILTIAVTIFSCKKDHSHDNEATITISQPIAGSMYNQGDTVFIAAAITADKAMHGWEVYIRKKSDQTQIYSEHAHEHAASYAISTFWVNSITEHADMELEVIATIDHDGTTVNKKVDFHCHQ